MNITGNNQYVCIPDENGIYNNIPEILERGTVTVTNYDDIKALKEKDGLKMQDVLTAATKNYIIDLLKSDSKLTTSKLDAELAEYPDSGTIKKMTNTVVNGVVYLYDNTLGQWLS